MKLLQYYSKMGFSNSNKRLLKRYINCLFTHDIPNFLLFENHNMKFNFFLDKRLVYKIKDPRGFYLMMKQIDDGVVCCPVIEKKPYLVLEKEESFNAEKFLPGKQVEKFLELDDFVPTLTDNPEIYIRNQYMHTALFDSLEEANEKYRTHPNFNPRWEGPFKDFIRTLERSGVKPIKTKDKFETGVMRFTAYNKEQQIVTGLIGYNEYII